MQQYTDKVLEIFKEITKIPRCSGKEARFRMWLQAWAEQHRFTAFADTGGNLLVRVPASAGYEDSPTVVIQSHMDMVCEKTPNAHHDFAKDPLRLIEDDEWLSADNTTLGADNGIGIAIAMTLASDDGIRHPPLELLFTVEEEVGLLGAQRLAPGFLEGNTLLNLDSEEDGVIIIGCAGGQETHLELPLKLETCPPGYSLYRLKIAGLSGGHSGIDIHKRRANAIKVMAALLHGFNPGWRLASLEGGSAHNVIPREATAILALPKKEVADFQQQASAFAKKFRTQHAKYETSPAFTLLPLEDKPKQVYTSLSVALMLDLILALPHGVAERIQEMPNLVETSNNIATIKTGGESAQIASSQRSSIPASLDDHTRRIEAIARLAGADASTSHGYPSWVPVPDSPLLHKCRSVYNQLFGAEPRVEVIHAGLECGVLHEKYPYMEMVSYGPTILNAHSPKEAVHLPSVGKVYALSVKLLEALR